MTLASTETCILSASDPAWDEALTRVPHDIFHTALYHRVPALGVSGTPEAFLFQENDQTFLWPYYRAPIPAAPGYFDVNSAYGYPGPVGRGSQPFFQRAWHALLDHWRKTGVVSVFTRFNPLLQNVALLDGVTDLSGEPAAASIRELGLTVSVDLTLTPDEQLRRYQKRLRQTIRKLYDQGFTVSEDPALQHLPDFVRMYNQTMARLMSRPEYRLELDWFEQFRAALGPHLRLLVCRHEGRLAAADLVLAYGPFVHSHFTGTCDEFVHLSPSKLLLDFTRVWGTEIGARSMHLGGGLGARQDSLFESKSRYSPLTHPFHIGAWTLNRAVDAELSAAHAAHLTALGVDPAAVTFFPFYRYQPEAIHSLSPASLEEFPHPPAPTT
jgi:hypothetical protein